MTRARAKAIRDKVNSFLSTCDLDSTLNGLLPHADTLCILRYNSQEEAPKDQAVKLKRGRKEEKETSPLLAVLPVPWPVLPASPGATSPASHVAKTRATGSTANTRPVEPGPGSTDGTSGPLPVEACQTCSNAAQIEEIVTGSTGWTIPVEPALRDDQPSTPRVSAKTSCAPPGRFYRQATGTTGAAEACVP